VSRPVAFCLFVTLMVSCHSSAPVAPPYPEADSACVIDERITEGRLIRTADGAPLALPPCPDGGSP
jgi:hypothetical protein